MLMKKIYILEQFDFSNEQLEKLKSLGDVKLFKKASQKEITEAVANADVVMLDWLDPTNIITKMKKGSFVCLPFTGYGWITTLKQALDNGVVISNTPHYSTNAVAEHHLGLILDVAKHITLFNNELKQGSVPFIQNTELGGKTIGIIGLGHIGKRLAELLKPFNANLITYSRSMKTAEGVKNVDLITLLKESDIICVTCDLNPVTSNMLSTKELAMMKDNAILTTTTYGIINLNALEEYLNKGKFFGIGLEEFMDMKDVPMSLLENPKVVCTYHRAYDTKEAEENRLDIAIANIEAYINGKPINEIKL